MRGRDIKRYGYTFSDLWLINTHNGIKEKGMMPVNIDEYPVIKEHLNRFYKDLAKRTDKGVTPYNLRNCAYMEDFSKQKVIWIELVDNGRFAFDRNDNYLTLNGTFIMTGNDLEYLCCVLNNPITSWHFNTFCISSGVGTNQWRELYVQRLLIPNISKNKLSIMTNKINEILQADTIDMYEKENELKLLVYNLFELSQDEIAFVESYN